MQDDVIIRLPFQFNTRLDRRRGSACQKVNLIMCRETIVYVSSYERRNDSFLCITHLLRVTKRVVRYLVKKDVWTSTKCAARSCLRIVTGKKLWHLPIEALRARASKEEFVRQNLWEVSLTALAQNTSNPSWPVVDDWIQVFSTDTKILTLSETFFKIKKRGLYNRVH